MLCDASVASSQRSIIKLIDFIRIIYYGWIFQPFLHWPGICKIDLPGLIPRNHWGKDTKKNHLTTILIVLGLLLPSTLASADQSSSNLNVNVKISARAKLTLSTNTISFPDADPDTAPFIPASENAVAVTVKVRTGYSSSATLTHQAAGNLASGSSSIPISNVTWTATGSGFSSGTMSSSAAQTVGSWTGSGTQSGALNFSLANSWSYTVGTYTVSSTYTLTAP